MQSMNAPALVSLMTLSACSTTSQPQPSFVTATCPPAQIIRDREFRLQPPVCLGVVEGVELYDGIKWGDLAVNSVKSTADLLRCISEVNIWIDNEKLARGSDEAQ